MRLTSSHARTQALARVRTLARRTLARRTLARTLGDGRAGTLARPLAGGLWVLLALQVMAGTTHAQQPSVAIENLLGGGWDVAGYVAVSDNRSLILFKHKQLTYLVQCSVLIDVMRNPRVVTYCYELK